MNEILQKTLRLEKENQNLKEDFEKLLNVYL